MDLLDLLILLCTAVLVGAIVVLAVVILTYQKSTYYRSTHIPYFKMRFDLGHFGEYLTYKQLRILEKSGAKFLFNCYLPKENGQTTEADVLLIAKSGIYVFESKNYSGWIFGQENAKFWTQTLPAGKGKKAHKEQFLNPIFQNKLHIDALHKLLGDGIPLHSVIVFSERCVFKDLAVSGDTAVVVHRSDVGEAILKINENFQNSLTPEAVEALYQKLHPYTQVTEEVKQAHISNIQKNHAPANHPQPIAQTPVASSAGAAETDDPQIAMPPTGNETAPADSSPLRCPKCGGTLVLHTAKRGDRIGKKFYGCSNFPKCRYVQNIEE